MLAIVAAVVVGGVNIFGGSGTVVGAVIGALFLGFVANALILVGLSQFWLQAIYGVVILVAVGTDALIARRVRAPRPSRVASRDAACPRSSAGRRCCSSSCIALIVIGNALSPVFLTPGNFSNLLSALMEVGIMALPMTLVIIAGEIDLSVESMAGLSSAVLGFLWAAGRARSGSAS